MKKAEGEEQLPVEDGSRAAVELVLRHQLVQTLQVGLHTLGTTGGSVECGMSVCLADVSALEIGTCEQRHLWWFGGHLDASLQDCNGKFRMWRRAEPESEVWVGLLHL